MPTESGPLHNRRPSDSPRIEDYFTIERMAPGWMWVRAMDGTEYGPITLPVELTRLCAEGWSMSACLVQGRRGWRFVEVGSAYPY